MATCHGISFEWNAKAQLFMCPVCGVGADESAVSDFHPCEVCGGKRVLVRGPSRAFVHCQRCYEPKDLRRLRGATP